ncbi:ATP-binding protein [Streptomyces sp. NPDC053431]|uniref:ATP-binding protein n=1 Tax=Streptomyces sp. NPDC053431 TaxID=3365703 RepID=UPI0037D3076F
MSLPLTRRIARAALLVAAGAAPVVGAAGSASALDHSIVPTGGLSGLTALDSAAAGSTVDTASQTATGVVGETGSKAVGTAAPAAGKTLGTVGETAGAATESAEAPTGGAVGSLPTGDLPTNGLMGGLPLGG